MLSEVEKADLVLLFAYTRIDPLGTLLENPNDRTHAHEHLVDEYINA